MFRIMCNPSSGSTELCLTKITRGGSQIFFVCLVGVWHCKFEPSVCVYGTTGWELVPSPSYRAHTPRTSTRQTSVNHYKFQSSTAQYSLMMDRIRSKTCWSDFYLSFKIYTT